MTSVSNGSVIPAETAVTEAHELDKSALSGVAWSGAAKWSTQLLSWAGTFIVARILTPGDYGLLGMASVFLGIVMMLSESGVGTAVITLRELSEEELAQLNSFSLLLGIGGTVLTFLMAYPLGVFFRAPNLPPVLMLVGLNFTIAALAIVPAALLRRELKFRTLASIDIGRGLTVPFVTLIGALLGLRYWALAIGSIVGATLTTTLTLYHRREAYHRPRRESLRRTLNFSRDLLVSRVAWISYQNGDFAVAGRRLGEAALGGYTMAWTLATTPIEKVALLLSDVTPSLFSAVQHNQPALRRYFLLLTEALCFAVLPASLGIALVSTDLVRVALGDKWAGTEGPLALLALYAGARSISTLYGHLFNAARDTRFSMWTSVALGVFLLVGFVVGSHWGPVGIAAAWLVVHPSFSLYSFRRCQKILDLRFRDYLRSLRLGLDGSVVMGVAVLAFQYLVAPTWHPSLRLIGSIAVGAVTFAGTTLLIHRVRLKEIVATVKKLRKGGLEPA